MSLGVTLTSNNITPSGTALAAVGAGGTGPYTYAFYRGTTAGFTPGGGNLISGAATIGTFTDSGLSAATTYYYKSIVTDTGNSNATATSAALTVTTAAAPQSQNQLAQTQALGDLDQAFNSNTLACQVDAAQSTPLVAGQAVKLATTTGGVPKIVACAAASDACVGFVNATYKDATFAAGKPCSISILGNVMFLQAVVAINRGQFLTSLPAAANGGTHGGVTPVTGSSGFPIIGWAMDTCVAGALVRVFLRTPCASYEHD